MKNSEVITLNHSLKLVSFDDIKDSKFQYAITRNIRKSTSILESLQKDIDALKSETFVELKKEYHDLFNKYVSSNTTEIKNNNETYASIETKALKSWEKREEWITLNKELEESLKPIYDCESEFKPFMLKFDTLPNLNQSQMNAIYDLIDKDESNI